jgi:hypothetical protein
LIASSTEVSIPGSVIANGSGASGFPGAGGAIRVVAPSLIVQGTLNALGGVGLVNSGLIRLEATAANVRLGGSSSPAAMISDINPQLFPSASPGLRIASVGGQTVPTWAGQRTDTVDLLLPMQLPDPINIVVSATNIPTGTSVGLSFGTGNTGTVTNGTLAGTFLSSSATVRVSGLNRQQLAYLFVHATFDVTQGADAGNPAGPDQVAHVRAAAPPGGATDVAFLRRDGSRIPLDKVPETLLRQYGR